MPLHVRATARLVASVRGIFLPPSTHRRYTMRGVSPRKWRRTLERCSSSPASDSSLTPACRSTRSIICWRIEPTNPSDRDRILELERELLGGLEEGAFVTPSFRIDCASQVHLGRNVFFIHSLTMMSLGGITVEDGVMVGPGAGFFTVNHEPGNIRTVMAKGILVKRDAWIGARASILPGVTIGEGAIVGTGAVVTRDVPDGAVVAGVPAKAIRRG